MKTKITLYTIIMLAAGLMSFLWLSPTVKVYMIGDSTMCLYPTRQLPINGWGMPFANYFDAGVTIDNRAKGGRSTRTFLAENRWQPIVDSLKAGDYVLIQFGHNDEGPPPQYADSIRQCPIIKLT
jgi:lysophospholipase L1-like esterase